MSIVDLLAERGITVTYEAFGIGVPSQRERDNDRLTFGLDYARRLRHRRDRQGDTWYLDELFVKIQGRQQYLHCRVPWTKTATSSTSLCSRGAIGSQPHGSSGKLLKRQGREPEKTRPRASPPDHGQAAQLLGGAPYRDAIRGPLHGTVCEQPRGGLASTDSSARAPDAAVHVDRPPATLRIGARRRTKSLPGRPTSTPRCSLAPAENALFRYLG